jgi:Abnormal spindle-like microcephaly-assoc'd, ASPM-SPD-2-Hydin
MAEAFSITTASGTIELDANRQGGASFSVTDVSDHPIRARADVVAEAVAAEAATARAGRTPPQAPPAPPPGAGWFAIAGQAERSFPVGGTEVYEVEVTVPAGAAPPPGAPARSYRFRLDVLGTDNPDEDQAQGQWVEFAVMPEPAAPRPFPWLWLILAAAALVVVIGVVVAVVVLTQRHGTLSATPTTVNFGTVAVSATATQAVTVKNTGSAGTTVNAAVSGSTDFKLATATCSGQNLDPNATCVINVTFTPAAKGSVTGSLQITGNHATTTTVALTGTGGGPLATASPTPFTLVLSKEDDTAIWRGSTTITNSGTTPLHVTSASVSVPATVQDGCLGQAVAPSQHCTITVTVSVAAFQVAPSGTLLVSSDATGSPLQVPFT